MARRLSIAPMMDWTDRHCRYLLRLIAPQALLYTEMVTASAIIHGDRPRHLAHDQAEHMLALQLGGSEPSDLQAAVKIAEPFGYDEYNLNCGCPSERVQKGAFGASLMAEPHLVADCLKAMADATPKPVTVKTRIGIDDAPVPQMLTDFVGIINDAGIKTVIIHARKALLKGLSPKQNREVPPLQHPLAHDLKRQFPNLTIIINGGVTNPTDAQHHITQGLDGVMIGRHAYHQPMSLQNFAQTLQPQSPKGQSLDQILQSMASYAAHMHHHHQTPLPAITRHMLGLAHGLPGARHFRRLLSDDARKPDADASLIAAAAAALKN